MHIARQSKARKEKQEQVDRYDSLLFTHLISVIYSIFIFTWRIIWTEKTRPSFSSGKQNSNWSTSAYHDNDGTPNYDNTYTSSISKNGGRSRLYNDHVEDHEVMLPNNRRRNMISPDFSFSVLWHSFSQILQRRSTFRNEEGDEDNIPVVELLEKERKDWQLERLKLIHCIHLQQIELSQRSVAAYDRATDIAKVDYQNLYFWDAYLRPPPSVC